MRELFAALLNLTTAFAILVARLPAAARQVPTSATLASAPVPAPDSAIAPQDRLNEPWWAARHKAVLAAVAAHPDAELLVIGDSITQNYDRSDPPDEVFQPTWRAFYAPRGALNLGFGGDTTANLLWRLQNGELRGLHPRAVVLMIGTNDTGHAELTAEQTERGVDAVVAELTHRLPQAKILLVGILPSGISAAKTAADRAVNQYLAAAYAGDPQVTYLDIGSVFTTPAGDLDTSLFYDPRRRPQPGPALHPDTVGQRRMAEAVEPTLANLLGEPPAIPLAAMTDINTALIPVPRLERDFYDWYARHHAELLLARTTTPSVVMIGDSITQFWAGAPAGGRVNGPQSWARLFGDAPVLNLGFGWDRTQNVLWRLRQGEFEGMTPKWVVINIGTNNLTATDHARANTPQEVADGVAQIVHAIHARSPASRIVLMGVFPRGASKTSALRAPITETNRLLAARFAPDPEVTYLDIGARFLTQEGDLPAAYMPDGVHPSEAGYAIWAEALRQAGVGR